MIVFFSSLFELFKQKRLLCKEKKKFKTFEFLKICYEYSEIHIFSYSKNANSHVSDIKFQMSCNKILFQKSFILAKPPRVIESFQRESADINFAIRCIF